MYLMRLGVLLEQFGERRHWRIDERRGRFAQPWCVLQLLDLRWLANESILGGEATAV